MICAYLRHTLNFAKSKRKGRKTGLLKLTEKGVKFNPDYALGFVMRAVSAIKSSCLETEA
jgi:hypothetical protein